MQSSIAVAALTVGGLFFGATGAKAQSAILNLPRVSQHARLAQRIGITDITVDYHRPLVNRRKIFGPLQAYGEVWRAGAHENTIFDVSDAVTIPGHTLPYGLYAPQILPGQTSRRVSI